MARLAGKVALISGAVGSFGAEMVRTFVREGAAVVFGDTADASGNWLEGEILAAGGRARYVHLDVTREADWRQAVQAAVRRFGKLDILVNNAGIVPPNAPIEERSVEEWDRTMAVNARGVFLGTKWAIPALREAGGGAIVNISPVAAAGQSQPMEAAYAASRGAVRIFTKVTAAQQARDGIRCNSVHPGPIDSGLLAAGVLYLASDEAARTTGTELRLDGGGLAQ